MIETSRDGPLKAMLIADPPGLGKTLISMMAVVKAMADARRFSIVAVPSSCMEQWCGEFEKFFVPVCLSHFVFNTHQTLTNRLQGSVRVLPVRDPTIQPTTMLKHDAIIVSYSFVMSQYRKALKYREKIARFKKDGAHPAPHRPDISIFSEIFSPDNNDVSSPFLVLDEAHAIKTECALTFAAIFELHEQCDNCLMLTGSPLDNTWKDVFAFLQFVKGHNLSAKHRMIRLLGNPSDNYQKWGPPKSQNFSCYVQMLNSFIVRRPESTIDLPRLVQRKIAFSLDSLEVWASNKAFDKYKIAVRLSAEQKGSEKKSQPFKSLLKALQHACHRDLVVLMDFIRHKNGDEDKIGPSEEEDDPL